MLPFDFDSQLMFQPPVATLIATGPDYSNGQLLSPVRKGARVPVVHDGCRDVDVLGKGSSANYYSPVGVVLERPGYRWHKKSAWYNTPSDVKASIKVSILDSPEHGQFVAAEPTAEYSWIYEANPDFLNAERSVGEDHASFLVEVSGRRFKVAIDLMVHQIVDYGTPVAPCKAFFRTQQSQDTQKLDKHSPDVPGS